MPQPTTLSEYADDLVATAGTARDAARARMEAARTAETDARQAETDAAAALAAATKATAAIRKQLAAASTPADAEALAEDLGEAVVAQRRHAGELAQAQLARAKASGEATLAAMTLRRITAEATSAKAQAAAEKAGAARRETAMAALEEPPLDEIADQATDLLADPLFGEAESKVEADIPAPLRERAVAQAAEVDREIARREDIEEAVRAALDAGLEEGGLAADTIPRLRADLEAAEAALQAYAGRAGQRLQGARSALERLAAGESVLSEDQHDSLFDPDLETERGEAAEAEAARDTALTAARDAHKALAIEREKFIAEDPEADLAAAEADTSTPVGAAKKAADDADQELSEAEDDFSDGQWELLAAWRADVPEAAWANLTAFAAAKAALDDLKADPAPLVAAVTAAEGALLAALLERDRRNRRLAQVADAAAARHAAAADYARSAEALRSLVLRGVA
jgi:hypothetical protein